MTQNIQIEPGEITIVLADDMNLLSHHACHTARQLAEKGIGVQLLNCGMMNRRFWLVAREEAGSQLDLAPHKKRLHLKTMSRGHLYNESEDIRQLRLAFRSKVLIICGWEWASKSWRLKEDLIYHLREIAEAENIAIIIYSQARTSPRLGCIDRGGIGKLASIALAIVRIEDDEQGQQQAAEPVIISPQDEIEAEKFAQLVAKEINDLPAARFEPEPEEVLREEYAEKLEYAGTRE